MIARVWNGRTNAAQADAYRTLLTETIMPGIAARGIEGYLGYELWERDAPDGGTVFTTVLRFSDEAAIEGFVGKDRTRANLPDAALKLLTEWDTQAVHYSVTRAFE
ncbi:antibiotic biosynthesis monooxygenase [Erythrobacter rubeus]|uniref:Antibiotic biosynthesis monooxygenase n=1 Tax=Erythrobacter rubeus TaxID=2760803 RepID=A0ABR8KM77_9SPHN|nr:antibiotic biosynthesis monooxygenase [Erythrobacter rubeus]MBD2841592.1 antibiotic biosynthesis monooxygenase [Erythrobacter rubeus]